MINSLEELEVIQVEVDKLLDVLISRKHTAEEAERLNYLEDLIYEYESEYVEIEDIHGIELLKCLLEDGALLSEEDYQWVNNLINNELKLDESIRERLSKLFDVHPSIFLPIGSIPIYPSSGNVFEDIGFPNADEMLKEASIAYELSQGNLN